MSIRFLGGVEGPAAGFRAGIFSWQTRDRAGFEIRRGISFNLASPPNAQIPLLFKKTNFVYLLQVSWFDSKIYGHTVRD